VRRFQLSVITYAPTMTLVPVIEYAIHP